MRPTSHSDPFWDEPSHVVAVIDRLAPVCAQHEERHHGSIGHKHVVSYYNTSMTVTLTRQTVHCKSKAGLEYCRHLPTELLCALYSPLDSVMQALR